MERKWLAALLPLTMMGAVSLAANPFADVTPDDWAYQAVSELSEEGGRFRVSGRDVPRGAECDSL